MLPLNIPIRLFDGLPSGKRLQFAVENGPFEIVDLPIKNGGSFPSVFCMFTRPGIL
jgi:hypothetical protein